MVGDYIPELTGEDAEYFLKQVEENKHVKNRCVSGEEYARECAEMVGKMFGVNLLEDSISDKISVSGN